jgi:tripartite-type tricarboxylate transporter receptor subunit TctC
MKKIITILLAVCSLAAHASQTVSVVWPFNIGSTQANYARTLITEANKNQNKYTFVLENKTGAGSSIAANYVANSKQPAIMAATSSFFIRPNFFPDSSHQIEQFRPLMVQCAVPMIVVSKRYRSFKEISADQRITIGVSGLGTTTHLLTADLQKKYTGIQAIAYTGTMEPIKDVLGGNLDMAVGFPGELKSFIDAGQLNVVGISGIKPMPGMPLLSDQGFATSSQVINTHFLTVPKTVSESVVSEWREIFLQAAKSSSVQGSYAVDACATQPLVATNVDTWFVQQVQYWRRVTTGVKIN